ncbi:putative undecaprenyl-phosphate N-acetylglucosaminyl 1-phosphate transferase [Tepidimonas alkaliphilus]|uniref:Putative undecaprenyl-phosphate N-acetylglucosaminyl 1-phosphate transferase n=1 Tax=Tepidimonas alkaliphilus TaxID=2588942 RepID=A0A554W9G3_9BURK|nr:MraY family glycosyltransferase [Tepidimonas alkaliphilus]TSE20204.1 putative undecaprenyl-phosphate N-acetylglucosaminyl 1-phosphate transferase [Tepidimonas alkaliphilus]
MLIKFLVAVAVAFVGCGLGVRYTPNAWRKYPQDRPQRFYEGEVSRLGGVVLFLTFILIGLASGYYEVFVKTTGGKENFLWWVYLALALAPAWLAGTIEDIKHNVRPAWRFLATFATALLAIWLFDIKVSSLGVRWIDSWWSVVPWLSVLLPVMAVAALPHAINFIDGYNGLAATTVLLISLALLYVAIKVDDWLVASVVIVLTGVTLGFWFWNYPRGLLFAGDGGAYFFGGVVAISSLLLIQRNTEVSPWFPVLLLAYPLMELLFSIYRRLVRGVSPTVADALHFHQLIYRRIVRGVFEGDEVRRVLVRNNKTSPYLWGMALLGIIPAMLFWRQTVILFIFFVNFVFLYVSAYLIIIRFKTPRWLRR